MRSIKRAAYISLASALFFLSSCGTAQKFPAQTDPDISQYAAEQDNGDIIAFTEAEEYPLSFDRINVTIKNQDPGESFYFFTIPVVEYSDNGKWTRLNYSPDSYNIPEQRALCCVEGEPELQFSTVMTIWHDSLEGSWKAGDYRAVVFAGGETLYAPFGLKG